MLHASANRRTLAVILVCAFATGCVHRPVYWQSWAKQVIVESGACPAIDGDYQNAGERFLKAKHHTYERQNVSLANLLNGWVTTKRSPRDDRLGRTAFNPAEDAYQSVSLRLAEGKLHIRASRADGSTRAFDLPTRQQCWHIQEPVRGRRTSPLSPSVKASKARRRVFSPALSAAHRAQGMLICSCRGWL